ncbi:S-methyl-5'-thioinosine phosphorylase [Kingella potus]|uniref:S-methyl-5'-thioinosine phosphorylase n=1 Tax=Kingella potus TaxID=265175 RepID=A0A377R122_9NEIS|nr:S-methyl-5'-thioinosine phosphorylase [Kingella potus]STR00021.1 S-methyl-5'-thioinosine phosphorylase [Kingella potus]
MLAVIGGSGLTHIPELEITGRRIVRTPYGLPSAPLLSGRVVGREILFLARHGLNHSLAPHEINYRANIRALREAGAEEIIAVSAAVSLNPALPAGSLVLPHDLIDYTCGRAATFFENDGRQVVRTDFTEPYDPVLRQALAGHAAACGTPVLTQAVYACIQGPRSPTRAETIRLSRDGADIYGMTGMPEAILAREDGLPYACLCGIVAACDTAPQERDRHSRHTIAQIRRLLADWRTP